MHFLTVSFCSKVSNCKKYIIIKKIKINLIPLNLSYKMCSLISNNSSFEEILLLISSFTNFEFFHHHCLSYKCAGPNNIAINCLCQIITHFQKCLKKLKFNLSLK